MTESFIYDGLRTPFGRHGGGLSGIRPDDLMAGVLRELMRRTSIPAELIEDVIVGNANQAGEDARNVGRHAALLSGLPATVAGITVNRLCGSGLAAVAEASRVIRLSEASVVFAGGVESMSRAPLVISRATSAFDRTQLLQDSTLGARFPNPRLTAQYGADSLAQTADNVARELQITRAQSDAFALSSQTKCAAAHAQGFFREEITPVEVPRGRGEQPYRMEADEAPRPDTTVERLEKLRVLHEGGVTTAGNASGINDGAAAVVIGSEAIGERLGLRRLSRIVGTAVAGVEPRTMGLGPVPAIQKLLMRASLSLADISVIEINEAFAAQVLGCLKLLALSPEDERVNPSGGAIAIGHPLGASGARLALTAARQLRRIGGRYALVAMCIGVGQGIALLLENND